MITIVSVGVNNNLWVFYMETNEKDYCFRHNRIIHEYNVRDGCATCKHKGTLKAYAVYNYKGEVIKGSNLDKQ